MKAPKALLVATPPMQHVAMNDPFASIRVEKAQWESDHVVASRRPRLSSHVINKMTDRTPICKEAYARAFSREARPVVHARVKAMTRGVIRGPQ